MNEIVLQVCNKCLEEKDVSLFYTSSLVCKDCANKSRVARAQKNSVATAEYQQQWYREHRDHVLKRHHETRKNNPHQNREQRRRWRKKNKAVHSAQTYFANNGLKIKQVPTDLLAAKIEQLKLIHLIKELQDEERE